MNTYAKHRPLIWEDSSTNTEATYNTVYQVLQTTGDMPASSDNGVWVVASSKDIMGKIYSNGRFYNDPSEIPA